MAGGEELDEGVDVEEASRVDQRPRVALNLGVVPLPLEKSIHLSHQKNTRTDQDHTFNPNSSPPKEEEEEELLIVDAVGT